jgi:hypothetical protein
MMTARITVNDSDRIFGLGMAHLLSQKVYHERLTEKPSGTSS